LEAVKKADSNCSGSLNSWGSLDHPMISAHAVDGLKLIR
jgi:hypothetical protein